MSAATERMTKCMTEMSGNTYVRMKLVFEDCNHISMEPFCPNKEEFGAVMKSSFHILDSIDLTAEGTSRQMCFATMQFVQIGSAFSEFGSLFWVTIQH